jgi:hypothetical protein
MLKKVIWVIVILMAAVVVGFGLESVAGGMLKEARHMAESGRYEQAEERLDQIDGWFGWTDAGKMTAQMREDMQQRIAEEKRREEAERQRQEYEEAQAAWQAPPPDNVQGGGEGGGRGDGVYHGLNRAEKIRQQNRRE